ncbi:MAG: ATP-binding cassette domain-containing protein [Anaerolineales bacterium]|nr:ATP-binding cassette domain-containing protein [Anaerolineales bacterium]
MATIEMTGICKSFKGMSGFALLEALRARLPFAKSRDKDVQDDPLSRDRPFRLHNLNLIVPDGITMVILGPSGCGKTTVLRLIAGLIEPDEGEIRFDGENVAKTPPGERGIGMVFQTFALYPMYTARENILSYFLFREKSPEMDQMAEEKFEQTSKLLGVEISHLLNRMPRNLSPGEKQRVALGRCVTRDPKVILLDEPFSNLDQRLREKYRVNLKKLLRRYGVTTVYVTHDQHEAMILADLLAIMNIGTLEQIGTYERIYKQPANVFVAEFLNLDVHTPSINLLDGRLVSERFRDYTLGIRPESVSVSDATDTISIEGVVVNVTPIPLKGITIVNLKVDDTEFVACVESTSSFAIGSKIVLGFDECHLFDRITGKRASTFKTDQL